MPPGQNGPRREAARSQKNLPRPSVVEVDWRLPARLRRPVRAELARQRRRKRQRDAIVRFERRPLYTSTVGRPKASVEQHTADVYRAGRPSLGTAVPPYAGSFLKRSANAVREERLSANRTEQPAARTQKKSSSRPTLTALSGERDIPYAWNAPKSHTAPKLSVASPRRRFALPLHISVWPFGSGEKEAVPTSKKKAQNSDWLTL